MEEKKIKKKKLILTASPTKPLNIPRFSQSGKKKSVVIEKKHSRQRNERRFFGRDVNSNKSNVESYDKTKTKTHDNSSTKSPVNNRNFEIRKLAEERATKRFKSPKEENLQIKKSTLIKGKGSTSKREYKLTLSKALDDDAMEGKERSLASVRRARLKDKKNQDLQDNKI